MNSVVADLEALLAAAPVDLAHAALVIARVEFTDLDPEPSLMVLRGLGERGRDRLVAMQNAPVRRRIAALNQLIYGDERFAGNRAHYEDFRNSLLNVVLDRRLGIPITLAIIYLDVARRAGLEVFGVAFPGHFLLSVPPDAGGDAAVILDPFDGGQELDDERCRALLSAQLGAGAMFDTSLLRPCGSRVLLTRLLNNLKRTYVELRSFPQARLVIDLLLMMDPTQHIELRNRGLLAYRLEDFRASLDDLEAYMRVTTWTDDNREERDQLLEHLQTLRQRVAGMN